MEVRHSNFVNEIIVQNSGETLNIRPGAVTRIVWRSRGTFREVTQDGVQSFVNSSGAEIVGQMLTTGDVAAQLDARRAFRLRYNIQTPAGVRSYSFVAEAQSNIAVSIAATSLVSVRLLFIRAGFNDEPGTDFPAQPVRERPAVVDAQPPRQRIPIGRPVEIIPPESTPPAFEADYPFEAEYPADYPPAPATPTATPVPVSNIVMPVTPIDLARNAGLPVDVPPAPVPAVPPVAPIEPAEPPEENPVGVHDNAAALGGFIIYVESTELAGWVRDADQAERIMGTPVPPDAGIVRDGLYCLPWGWAGGALRQRAARRRGLDARAAEWLEIGTLGVVPFPEGPISYESIHAAAETLGVHANVIRLAIATETPIFGREWSEIQVQPPARPRRRRRTQYGTRTAWRVSAEIGARIEQTDTEGRYEVVRRADDAAEYQLAGRMERAGEGWFAAIGVADHWAREISAVVDWVWTELRNPTNTPRTVPDEDAERTPATIRQPNGQVGVFDERGRLRVRDRF